MPYDHKKSIRKLTDRQFSRDTLVDAASIDGALEDATERFNNIPVGDLSTRMTRSQFVFGYTPAPLSSQPLLDHDAGTDYIVPTAANGRGQNTWAPWLQIINSKYTSVTLDLTKDPTVAGEYGERFTNTFTPTEGFQNKWRIKGTNIEKRHNVANEAHAFSPGNGESYWGGSIGFSGQSQAATNGQQYAWTNSWHFNRPVIIDDISIMLRADNATDGLFDIDWSYVFGADNFGAQDFFIVLSVDSPVASEARSANDVEVHFGNQDMFISHVTMGQDPGAPFNYFPMQPLEQGHGSNGLTPGDGLSGRTIRFQDMNIPIHQGARVRLSMVVPVHADTAAFADAAGWSKENLEEHIFIQSDSWNDTTSSGTPKRYLAMHNFSMSGVLTVLEEVQT